MAEKITEMWEGVTMTEMKAYKSSDGRLFEDEKECVYHELNNIYFKLTSSTYSAHTSMPDLDDLIYFIKANPVFMGELQNKIKEYDL